MILIPAAAFLSVVMAFAWWVQRRLRNAGWVDAIWSLGLGSAGVAVALLGGEGDRRYLVAALIGAWGLRLGAHLCLRSRGATEDSRYAHFRREWGTGFERRMFGFLQIQAAAAFVMLVPVWLAATSAAPLGWHDAAAMLIAVVACGGEALADSQLRAFRADPRNHGGVCDTGLWAWSRHPNYVFEWLHWWAYPVLAFGSVWAVAALVGPAFMYWLLVHVSGIPPLEAQMLRSRGDAYRAYQRRVGAFMPWQRSRA